MNQRIPLALLVVTTAVFGAVPDSSHADLPSPAAIVNRQLYSVAPAPIYGSRSTSATARQVFDMANRIRNSVQASAQQMDYRVRNSNLSQMWIPTDRDFADDHAAWAHWYGETGKWHAAQGHHDEASLYFEAATRSWDNAAWYRPPAASAADYGRTASGYAHQREYGQAEVWHDWAVRTYPY